MPAASAAPRGFVLCADDYGLAAGVNEAILDLLARGRISATGVMVNQPEARPGAGALRAFAGKADLGLHLTLTIGTPLTGAGALAPAGVFPGIGRWLGWSLGGPPRALIAAEIAAQFDAFEEMFGRPPDFLDGHQHVHALPAVRGALREVLARRALPSGFYVRDPADAFASIVARRRYAAKAAFLAGVSTGFGAGLRAAGIATNAGFAGFSAFAPDADLEGDFASYLVAPGPRHLVMCHPGGVDDGLRARDPVVESRPREWEYLRSPAFAALCARAGRAPMRLCDL